MLIPTQGKGVSSRSFFEADFGKNAHEFVRYLAMPEEHLGYRGIFIPKKKETEEETTARKKIWDENQLYLAEWNRLYNMLADKKAFIELIGDNKFVPEKLTQIENPISKKLYIHYLTKTGILKVFSEGDDATKSFVKVYIYEEFPVMYKRLVDHIYNSHVQQSLINGLLVEFKEKIIQDILRKIDFSREEHYLINAFAKAQKAIGEHYFNFDLVKGYYLYYGTEIFNKDKQNKIRDNIENLKEKETRKQLLDSFDDFKVAVLKRATSNQIGTEYIFEQVEQQLQEVYRRLSILDL
jgi:hypothetical protein